MRKHWGEQKSFAFRATKKQTTFLLRQKLSLDRCPLGVFRGLYLDVDYRVNLFSLTQELILFLEAVWFWPPVKCLFGKTFFSSLRLSVFLIGQAFKLKSVNYKRGIRLFSHKTYPNIPLTNGQITFHMRFARLLQTVVERRRRKVLCFNPLRSLALKL